MLKIANFTCERIQEGCVTDNMRPRFSYFLESDQKDVFIKSAELSVNGWVTQTEKQMAVVYDGELLKPFTKYTATVSVTCNTGETAQKELSFETGRLYEPWVAKWITDPSYKFTEKRVSPTPMTFVKAVKTSKPILSAKLYATAMGIYEIDINGQKVGKDYFAPGFTSYKHQLQYQTYDVTNLLTGNDTLVANVSGGWAVGSFVFTRKNRVTADRQALLLEIRIAYKDGTSEVIGTDESWKVTEEGPYKLADIYDGETYDATVNLNNVAFCKAGVEKLRVFPRILAEYGAPVRAHELMRPVSCVKAKSGELIFDFGQNFAGVISAAIKGKKGQKVVFRHSEILKNDGELFTELLRTAKATATYVCKDGEQMYSPKLTYMGFRYVGVTGIDEKDLNLTALALYSEIEQTGTFTCSNKMLNKLQSNICWSAKSNFIDIPTDCPQRDERMGWTGDIALFSRTACYNYDMSRFLEKWLKDVKSEQKKSGGIPNTVPVQGYGFPATMPVMAVDHWGDACVLVPYAEYLARGDVELLSNMYQTMKRYVKACKFWANLFSVGKSRYIWNSLPVLHFGDWVAPDVKTMAQWQARCKWTATASLKNTSGILAKIAHILGQEKDAQYYEKLSEKVADAYVSVLTDGNGKLKNEFQTAYVLPLYYGIFSGDSKRKAADNLAALVKKSDYCIGTGFPGTPYILFALSDNGHKEEAFKMLLNTKCPSWLFEVKAGGSTIWERWDALREDGSSNIGSEDGTGGMVSFNHYTSGAVGDFLYRRIVGVEPIDAGYKTFKIKPLMGGGLTSARGEVMTPYGIIASDWKITDGKFTLCVQVPVGATCQCTLPSGKTEQLNSGSYVLEEKIA